MKIKELLNSPEKWAKGYYAYDKHGQKCSPCAKWAKSFCLTGANSRCYKENKYTEVFSKLAETIAVRHHTTVVRWNDAETTKFEDVKQLIEELDV